jgi:hypothetical protein
LKKTAQSKQSSNRRKFSQSGHPGSIHGKFRPLMKHDLNQAILLNQWTSAAHKTWFEAYTIPLIRLMSSTTFICENAYSWQLSNTYVCMIWRNLTAYLDHVKIHMYVWLEEVWRAYLHHVQLHTYVCMIGRILMVIFRSCTNTYVWLYQMMYHTHVWLEEFQKGIFRSHTNK